MIRAALPIFLLLAALLAAPHAPYTAGHRLTTACQWHARPLLGFLGPLEPDTAAQAAEFRCWQRHGLASPSPFVRVIVRKFPTQAELTAWRNDP